jgi:hypothetical protein
MAVLLHHGAEHADAELIAFGAAAHIDIGINKKNFHRNSAFSGMKLPQG